VAQGEPYRLMIESTGGIDGIHGTGTERAVQTYLRRTEPVTKRSTPHAMAAVDVPRAPAVPREVAETRPAPGDTDPPPAVRSEDIYAELLRPAPHDTDPMFPRPTADLPPIRKRIDPDHRKGRPHGPPIWVVIHTAECAETSAAAENLQSWAVGTKMSASWHYAVDDDSITQTVEEMNISWAAPGANEQSVNIELAGYARQTAEQWDDDFSRSTLDLAARLTAHICKRWDIPPVKVGPTEMRAGFAGICGHVDVTRGVGRGRTNHVDPGVHFPWDRFIDCVAGYLELLR
jgi:hypothetical protein